MDKKNAHHLASKLAELARGNLEDAVPNVNAMYEALLELYLSIDIASYFYAGEDKQRIQGIIKDTDEIYTRLVGLQIDLNTAILELSLLDLGKANEDVEPTD